MCIRDRYSDLGGHGPLPAVGAADGAQGIRYVNVGEVFSSDGQTVNIDLLVTNTSAYTPHNASLNILNGQFAQVNVACNTDVWLRVHTMFSCSTGSSCGTCSGKPTQAERDACFSSGCSCFGTTVNSQADCSGISKESKRENYGCALMDTPIIVPNRALVSMTVYDFETGALGDYSEELLSLIHI